MGKNARIHSLTACCRVLRQGEKRAQAPSTPTKIMRGDRCFFADADWAIDRWCCSASSSQPQLRAVSRSGVERATQTCADLLERVP
jgi:hypothetical protein